MKPIEAVLSRGFALERLTLPLDVRGSVEKRNWIALDRLIQRETESGGLIFETLRTYLEFSRIEFIISIRSSLQEPDEDGIWHDDGSRVLAFSLSLTLDTQGIEGGVLEFRRREMPEAICEAIPTQPYGTMIVFATGCHGFEHKINRVIRGERIVIAGWCS